MCPWECFALYKRPFQLVLCYKKDWATLPHPCYYFHLLLVTNYLATNYLLPLLSVLAENTLLKTAYHFLLLLVGFDTLTYRKDYDWSPILVGHQAPFPTPWPKLSLVFEKNCFTNMAVWLTGPRRQWVVLGSFIPHPYSGTLNPLLFGLNDFANSNIRFSWSHPPGELDYLQLFLSMYIMLCFSLGRIYT